MYEPACQWLGMVCYKMCALASSQGWVRHWLATFSGTFSIILSDRFYYTVGKYILFICYIH